ncbi:MAG: hypothetical protein A2998_00320 [Candidatus Staskawiczbacteria bacterium RIFCSPLOWO2_01_FULL_37_25b]|uniref:Aspartyl/glutamyl-tRNA(Asn/Gln) amidotransferase subunit C n=2 Tax=Parcubacteria group TaxID=1794811 RepID=A0A1F8F7K3_9BACT|nr:MAG: hypothetical protein A3C61_02340 [Candidatus Yanofskybacteria bacterium RIFCSPHIGHO2_02_FULL_39_10]OGZ71351.1 MAG: hypothetical protein A2998_00320 [Candidatus Staskawiczbacteria bacterium RIFCSPLOWO2_01_FULL_37_25b]
MLTEKEIKHVAQLARIKITEKEEEKFKKELSAILDYINKLGEVNTENVDPLYQVTGLVNSMRSDDYRRDFVIDEDLNKKLIDQAPDKEEGFIKVKSVLNK